MALGQGPQALLTTLYRSTDCLCRRGAAMKNLAQSASLHAGENNAPSKLGTKHLACVEHPVIGLVLAVMLAGVVLAHSTIPVRGPAVWQERAINNLDSVHAAVRVSAQRLQERLPGVRFRLGELIQDRVTLDPYLLVEYGTERAVLGIWDEDGLISPRCDTLRPSRLYLADTLQGSLSHLSWT